MDELLAREDCDRLLAGRVGLVCHPASLNRRGEHSASLLWQRIGDHLGCLIGPEHGFWGTAGPGVSVADDMHPRWPVPIYSLYGDTECAMNALAHDVDVVVVDLQDLGVRCYTYVHTLRQVLELAAQKGMRVVVTDRAVPWACGVDGPMATEEFRSIVAPIPAPYVYGMTPGETAGWLVDVLQLDVDLTVVSAVYERSMGAAQCWPEWIPPSPAIRSWNCAACFPVTVFTESLLHLDCARDSEWAFRVLRAEWLQSSVLVEALAKYKLPGITFIANQELGWGNPAVEIEVLDTTTCQPAYACVVILYELMQLHGAEKIWAAPEVRSEWFDKLMGTDQTREALLDGETPAAIRSKWLEDLGKYARQRESHLLYPHSSGNPFRVT